MIFLVLFHLSSAIIYDLVFFCYRSRNSIIGFLSAILKFFLNRIVIDWLITFDSGDSTWFWNALWLVISNSRGIFQFHRDGILMFARSNHRLVIQDCHAVVAL